MTYQARYFSRSAGMLLGCLALAMGLTACQVVPLPEGLDFEGPQRSAENVRFLRDATYLDGNGVRQTDQQIFDEIFRMIANAEKVVLVDMFLFNDFQGEPPETTRALAGELTSALLARREVVPALRVVVITDPLNTLYGGLDSAYFYRLRKAGVEVVETNLDRLRDSNPAYSLPWRLLVKPFGNRNGFALPNPLGEGRVSIRSYLKLLNFKANHRKVVVADAGEQLRALVTSANPHDGSSAHRNIALRFDGLAALDVLQTENAVLALSGTKPIAVPGHLLASEAPVETGTTLQVVTEQAIEDALLTSLAQCDAGERADLVMFYLSDRKVVDALKEARSRGVNMRLLLDPNKDAFGREKNGIPNRQVAQELHDAGITIRWCDTRGEQCHSKMLITRCEGVSSRVLLGSANYTRRNLDNFNLETNVVLMGPSDSEPVQSALRHFNAMWTNLPGQHYSVGYASYAESSTLKTLLYRFMERTGISTF